MPGMGAYCASKYAVRAIGQTLSVELHGSGVSCTTIYPGFIESELEVVNQVRSTDAVETRSECSCGLPIGPPRS